MAKKSAKKSVKKPVTKATKKTVAKPAKKIAKKTAAKAAPKPVKKPAKKLAKSPAKKPAKSPGTKKPSAKQPVAKVAAKKTADLSKLVSPLDDRVLVETVELATRTPGGLYIPDSVDRGERHKQGTVVAVGRGHMDRKGKLRPLDVQLGDIVLFDHYMGSEIEIAGKDLIVLRESQLLGVVKP